MAVQIGTAFFSLDMDNSEFDSALGDATSSLESNMTEWGATATAVGGILTAAVTAPLVGIGAAAVATATTYEDSFARIVALTSTTEAELSAMEGTVQSLAATYGVTGAEALEALFFILSGGQEGAQAMDTLEAALQGAAVGLGSVEDLSRVALRAVELYGEESLTTAEALDIFGAAASESVFGPDELASALGRVIPALSLMDVELDTAAALLAFVSPSFDTASEAATGMNAAITAINRNTPQFQRELEGSGVSAESLRQTAGEEGLAAALLELGDAVDGDVEALTRMMGTQQAARFVMALMAGDADDLAGTMDNVADASGFVSDGMDVVAETTSQQLSVAMAEASRLFRDIGAVIIPMVNDVLQMLIPFVQQLSARWNELSPSVQRFITIAGGVLAAIGPILIAFGSFITIIAQIIPFISRLLPIVRGLGLVIAGLSAPVSLTIAAITALVGGLIWAYNNVEWFRDAVDAVWQTIVEIFRGALEWIQQRVESFVLAVVLFWQEWGDTIMGAAAEVMDFLQDLLATAWEVIQGIWDAATSLLTGDFQGFAEAVSGIADTIQEFLVRTADRQWENVRAIWDGALSAITNAWETFRTNISNATSMLMEGLRSLWETMVSAVTSVVQGFIALITGDWQGFTSNIREALATVMGALPGIVQAAMSSIATWIVDTGNRITEAWSQAWEIARTTVSGAVSDIVSTVQGFVGNVVSAISGMVSNILQVLQGLPSAASSIASSMVSSMASAIRSAAGRLASAARDVVRRAIDAAKGALGISSPSRVFAELGRDTVQGFQDGLDAITPTLPLPVMANGRQGVTGDVIGLGASAVATTGRNALGTVSVNRLEVTINVESMDTDQDMEQVAEQVTTRMLQRLATQTGAR